MPALPSLRSALLELGASVTSRFIKFHQFGSSEIPFAVSMRASALTRLDRMLWRWRQPDLGGTGAFAGCERNLRGEGRFLERGYRHRLRNPFVDAHCQEHAFLLDQNHQFPTTNGRKPLFICRILKC